MELDEEALIIMRSASLDGRFITRLAEHYTPRFVRVRSPLCVIEG
jgi:hypothetical protein